MSVTIRQKEILVSNIGLAGGGSVAVAVGVSVFLFCFGNVVKFVTVVKLFTVEPCHAKFSEKEDD